MEWSNDNYWELMKGEIKASNNGEILFVETSGSRYKVKDNGWLDVFFDSFGGMVGGEYALIANCEIVGKVAEGILIPDSINFPNFDEFVKNISLNYKVGIWVLEEVLNN